MLFFQLDYSAGVHPITCVYKVPEKLGPCSRLGIGLKKVHIWCMTVQLCIPVAKFLLACRSSIGEWRENLEKVMGKITLRVYCNWLCKCFDDYWIHILTSNGLDFLCQVTGSAWQNLGIDLLKFVGEHWQESTWLLSSVMLPSLTALLIGSQLLPPQLYSCSSLSNFKPHFLDTERWQRSDLAISYEYVNVYYGR